MVIQSPDGYWYYAKTNKANTLLEATANKYGRDSRLKEALLATDMNTLDIPKEKATRQTVTNKKEEPIANDQHVLVVMVEFANQKLHTGTDEPESIQEWQQKILGFHDRLLQRSHQWKNQCHTSEYNAI